MIAAMRPPRDRRNGANHHTAINIKKNLGPEKNLVFFRKKISGRIAHEQQEVRDV